MQTLVLLAPHDSAPGLLGRPDTAALLKQVDALVKNAEINRPEDGWNGYSMLHTGAGRVGGLDLGLVATQEPAEPPLAVFLMGADEVVPQLPADAFVVYQGHHGDAGASRADVIFPATAYVHVHVHPASLARHRASICTRLRAHSGCFREHEHCVWILGRDSPSVWRVATRRSAAAT